jgi:hypothetical protein
MTKVMSTRDPRWREKVFLRLPRNGKVATTLTMVQLTILGRARTL